MKKIYLLVITCFAINIANAQENALAKPSAECLKVAEFNKKMAPVKQADKVLKAEVIHVRDKRPVRQMNFEQAGLMNLDIYKWLLSDTSATGNHSELGTSNALASDRLYIETIYVKGGKVRFLQENILFCENKSNYKKPKQNLKLNDKLAEPKSCFQLTDFKNKLQGIPNEDTISVSFTLINTNGEKARMSLNTMKEIKQFNLYNWLTKGADIYDENGGTESIEANKAVKKIKAQPGDLVLVSVEYNRNGEMGYESGQLPICK